jgi:hypothetical protein
MDRLISQLAEQTSTLDTTEIEVQEAGTQLSKRISWLNLFSRESTPRKAQDDVIEASAGFKADGTYGINEANSTDSWYLRQIDFTTGIIGRGGSTGQLIPNLKNALRILDARIKTLFDASQASLAYVSVTVSRAEVLVLNSVPKTLIASAGTDNAIDIVSVIAHNEFLGAAYASANTLKIKYAGETPSLMELSNAFLTSSAVLTHKGVMTANVNIKRNKAIVLTSDTNPTTGDGYLKFFILYRIIALPSPS